MRSLQLVFPAGGWFTAAAHHQREFIAECLDHLDSASNVIRQRSLLTLRYIALGSYNEYLWSLEINLDQIKIGVALVLVIIIYIYMCVCVKYIYIQ